MQPNFMEIAERIRALREIMDITVGEMAEVTGVSPEDTAVWKQDRMIFHLPSCTNAASVSAST